MNKNYILGVFNDEATLVDAFEKVKKKGVQPVEVYTPYPIHEILDGMGNKTRITHAAFFYGLFAAIGILGFLTYAAGYSVDLDAAPGDYGWLPQCGLKPQNKGRQRYPGWQVGCKVVRQVWARNGCSCPQGRPEPPDGRWFP